MRGAEPPHEVARLAVPDAAGDLGDGEVGVGEQPPRLPHPPLGDPLLHGPAGAPPDHRREVPGREADRVRDVAQRDRLAVARLHDLEHGGEQRRDARLGWGVPVQAPEAHEQQREVGAGRVGVPVTALAQLGVEVGEPGEPRAALVRRHGQAPAAAAVVAAERRQQGVGAPGDQRRGRVDRVGREEHRPGPGVPVAGPGRRDDRTRRHDERVPRAQRAVPAVHAHDLGAVLEVEEHEEVVGVRSRDGGRQAGVPPHRDRRGSAAARVAHEPDAPAVVPRRGVLGKWCHHSHGSFLVGSSEPQQATGRTPKFVPIEE